MLPYPRRARTSGVGCRNAGWDDTGRADGTRDRCVHWRGDLAWSGRKVLFWCPGFWLILALVHGQAGGVTTDAGLSVDRWAQDALASVTHLARVHRAGLVLPDGGGRRLRFTANDRVNDGTVDWCHIDAYDDVPLNTAVRTGQPVLGGRSNRATLSRAEWRAPAGQPRTGEARCG